MNSPFKRTSLLRYRLRLALPILLLVTGSAFARPPVPTTNIQAAQLAIANAERVDAASLAGVELGEARGKLDAAQRAVEKKETLAAQRFADEGRAAAELAAAKAGAAKAMAVNKDIERATATLIEEMQRKTGDTR